MIKYIESQNTEHHFFSDSQKISESYDRYLKYYLNFGMF